MQNNSASEKARQLYEAMPRSTPAQARMAAMIAEAFINGLNSRDIMTQDSATDQQRQK